LDAYGYTYRHQGQTRHYVIEIHFWIIAAWLACIRL